MFKSKEMKATILAYHRLFYTADGKVVLSDLMKSCHFMGSTMGNDPYETAFNEGARSVLIRILKTININMEQLDRLVESMEKEEQENDY